MGDHRGLKAAAKKLKKRLTEVYDELQCLPKHAPLRSRKEAEYDSLHNQYTEIQQDILALKGQFSIFEEDNNA